jgi:hypothetical protein
MLYGEGGGSRGGGQNKGACLVLSTTQLLGHTGTSNRDTSVLMVLFAYRRIIAAGSSSTCSSSSRSTMSISNEILHLPLQQSKDAPGALVIFGLHFQNLDVLQDWHSEKDPGKPDQEL